MRVALVNIETDEVENIIELSDDYDPEAEGAYLPEDNYKIEIDSEGKAVIGGFLRDGVWEPLVPVVVTQPVPVEDKLEALLDLLVSEGTITQEQVEDIKTEAKNK